MRDKLKTKRERDERSNNLRIKELQPMGLRFAQKKLDRKMARA